MSLATWTGTNAFSNNATQFGISVVYANGYWVATGSDSNPTNYNMYYSTNGTTWTPIAGPFGTSGECIAVAYGNGYWVAVGGGASGTPTMYYATSPDQTWTQVSGTPFGTNGTARAVAYGGGYWVVVGKNSSQNGNNLYYNNSTPNTTWTSVSVFGSTGTGFCINYSATYWIIGGQSSITGGPNLYWNTLPNSTWQAITTTDSPSNLFDNGGTCYGIAYANISSTSYWVAVGQNNSNNAITGQHNMYWVSGNPGNSSLWTPISAFGKGQLGGMGRAVAYANGHWVAVGTDASTGVGYNLYYNTSTPSTTWSAVKMFGLANPGDQSGYSVAYGNGNWVAVGRDSTTSGNNVYYSTNGETWTLVSGVFGNSGNGASVAYGNGLWVTVGQYGGTGNIYGSYYSQSPSTVCFKQGSKILTDKGYVKIEELKVGDLVKTSENGFVPIYMIGHKPFYNPAVTNRIKEQLYKCSQEKYPELTEDLVITGCHSILVDNFKNEEQRNSTNELLGRIFVTGRKYRLPACLDERCDVYKETGNFTIYHIALENDHYTGNYGIYANGLLVESCSKRYLKELSNMIFTKSITN